MWLDQRFGHFSFAKRSVLQGRRVLSGGKGEISLSEGKMWESQYELAESLPLWLCCPCSMPKTYGFSCFVLECFINT